MDATVASRQRPEMLCKVPEITLYFWIIKILATTVGETAADFLDFNRRFGLTGTSTVMAVLLVGVLALQLASRRYVPWLYWLTVVLISIVGTLITENLTDNLGVPLWITAIAFSAVLAIIFRIWHASEGTLSIHSIFTTRRELFYWAAILFAFALGKAAGDLATEGLHLGYLEGIFIFGGLIALTIAAHYTNALNSVLAFWIAYILTRPLSASIGDLLSRAPAGGGLGLSSSWINAGFFMVIIALILRLTISGIDRPAEGPDEDRWCDAGID